MSAKAKLMCLLLVLIIAFTSLAVVTATVAYAGGSTATLDGEATMVIYDAPAYSVAGHCVTSSTGCTE
jgi:hypothetical protein